MQAQSDNLPKVDAVMMTAFFGNNPDFISAEIKSAKTMRFVCTCIFSKYIKVVFTTS